MCTSVYVNEYIVTKQSLYGILADALHETKQNNALVVVLNCW